MGILIFEGMRCGFLEGDFSISIDESGSLSSKAILSTSYNTLPLWLKLAKNNCEEARLAHQKIVESWPPDEETQKQLLLAELRPAMLSIVACSISIDALYDLMKPIAKLDDDTLRGWKKGKRSRVFQIAEVFRRTFRLKDDEADRCRKLIKEISGLRDRAVHPSHKIERSMMRDDIPVGLDWRFVAYRYSNCHVALDNTMRMFNEFFERSSWDQEISKEMKILEKSFIENQLS